MIVNPTVAEQIFTHQGTPSSYARERRYLSEDEFNQSIQPLIETGLTRLPYEVQEWVRKSVLKFGTRSARQDHVTLLQICPALTRILASLATEGWVPTKDKDIEIASAKLGLLGGLVVADTEEAHGIIIDEATLKFGRALSGLVAQTIVLAPLSGIDTRPIENLKLNNLTSFWVEFLWDLLTGNNLCDEGIGEFDDGHAERMFSQEFLHHIVAHEVVHIYKRHLFEFDVRIAAEFAPAIEFLISTGAMGADEDFGIERKRALALQSQESIADILGACLVSGRTLNPQLSILACLARFHVYDILYRSLCRIKIGGELLGSDNLTELRVWGVQNGSRYLHPRVRAALVYNSLHGHAATGVLNSQFKKAYRQLNWFLDLVDGEMRVRWLREKEHKAIELAEQWNYSPSWWYKTK